MPRALLNIDAAADQLGISAKTVRRYITNGELPMVRIGARVLVDPDDLDKFIDDRRTTNLAS